ncbi:MAG: hypothetical protein R6U63_01215, partial [Longimicrobiales bacterium]
MTTGPRELMTGGDKPPIRFDYLTRRKSFAELRELALSASKARPRSSLIDEEMWRAFRNDKGSHCFSLFHRGIRSRIRV